MVRVSECAYGELKKPLKLLSSLLLLRFNRQMIPMSYIDIITDALDGNEVDWLLLLYKQWVVELQLISQDLTFENRHVTRSMVGSYIINDFQKITHRPIGGCSRDI